MVAINHFNVNEEQLTSNLTSKTVQRISNLFSFHETMTDIDRWSLTLENYHLQISLMPHFVVLLGVIAGFIH